MIVVLSPDALSDLDVISDWIADDNPARADSFVDEIQERCQSLLSYPERFPEIGREGGVSVRKLTHSGYLVFYKLFPDKILVVRIIHGARDWAALFDG